MTAYRIRIKETEIRKQLHYRKLDVLGKLFEFYKSRKTETGLSIAPMNCMYDSLLLSGNYVMELLPLNTNSKLTCCLLLDTYVKRYSANRKILK